MAEFYSLFPYFLDYGGAEPISGSCTITHVSSPLMFLQLNNIGINATNSDFACSTNYHIAMN